VSKSDDLESLRAERDRLQRKLEVAEAARQPLALKAARGDKTSKSRLRETRAKVEDLKTELEIIAAAIAEADPAECGYEVAAEIVDVARYLGERCAYLIGHVNKHRPAPQRPSAQQLSMWFRTVFARGVLTPIARFVSPVELKPMDRQFDFAETIKNALRPPAGPSSQLPPLGAPQESSHVPGS
jgi:hypothetical protein